MVYRLPCGVIGAHVYDPECMCLACAYQSQFDAREEAGMHKAKNQIEISKVRDRGSLPAFIGLIHRHFQKALPALVSDQEAILNAPVDHLGLIVPEEFLTNVESIEIHYKK